MPDPTEAVAEVTAGTEPTQEQFATQAADIFDAEVAKKPAGEPKPADEPTPEVKSDEEPTPEGQLEEPPKGAKAGKKAEAPKADEEKPAKDIFPEIEKLHPGARQKASTPEFQAWLNQLPQNLQDMIDSGDPKASASILDMYDLVQAKPKPEPTAKVEEAPVEFKPFTFDQVKDVKFKDAQGNEQTIEQFRDQYDEIADAVLAIVNTVLPQALKGVKGGPAGDFAAKGDLMAFQNQIAGELFEARVERGAPGAGEKVQTPEFKTFLEKATPLQKRMFSEGSAKDVIEVIKEFDRVQGIEKTKLAAQKQRDKKGALDAVHGNGLRSAASMEKPASAGEQKHDPDQDEKDALETFNKTADELEKNKRRPTSR